MLERSGGARRVFATDDNLGLLSPHWSLDGASIAVAATDGRFIHPALIDVASGEMRIFLVRNIEKRGAPGAPQRARAGEDATANRLTSDQPRIKLETTEFCSIGTRTSRTMFFAHGDPLPDRMRRFGERAGKAYPPRCIGAGHGVSPESREVARSGEGGQTLRCILPPNSRERENGGRRCSGPMRACVIVADGDRVAFQPHPARDLLRRPAMHDPR